MSPVKGQGNKIGSSVRPEFVEGREGQVRCTVRASTGSARTVLFLALLLSPFSFHPSTAFATVKQEVYVTGTVESFGGYSFSSSLRFSVTKPGLQEIGKIVVDGLYNGEYPWIMRIYTDNLHFSGVAGAIGRPNPAGLVSKDGQFAIPLEIHSPAFGSDYWRRIPDLNEPEARAYSPPSEPGEAVGYTDCILMGIDPRNAAWVAGPDGQLFTDDDNLLGDVTTKTPFELGLRVDISPEAVKGNYDAVLYIEIVPAP